MCVRVCACVGVMLCALGVFVFNTNNLSRAWYRQNYNLPCELQIDYIVCYLEMSELESGPDVGAL